VSMLGALAAVIAERLSQEPFEPQFARLAE
jgi:hypothetical protein